MWHTSAGDRTLEGAEARLIREAIGWVLDMLEPETDHDVWLFGIRAFDHREFGQKLALLCQVGQALLRPDTPPPSLTALNEATAGVLYQGVRQCVQIEVGDDADGFEARHWRRSVLDFGSWLAAEALGSPAEALGCPKPVLGPPTSRTHQTAFWSFCGHVSASGNGLPVSPRLLRPTGHAAAESDGRYFKSTF